MYFTRGVLLEADLIASALKNLPAGGKGARIRIVYREGDIGEGAARSLATQLQASRIGAVDRGVPRNAPQSAIVEAVRGAARDEALVLWLRPADLAALVAAAQPNALYVSGVMAGLDQASLPAAWRSRAHLAYPADLPESRRVRVDYALAWFRVRKIPVEAEQVQADTWLACGLVSETVKHMVDAFIPDYLIERLEDTVEHRVITGYYPRLALGPHQRFASKGGYLVHYETSPGRDGQDLWHVVPDGEWTSP